MTNEMSCRVKPRDVGVELSAKSESQLFRWLLACLLFSGPFSADTAMRMYTMVTRSNITSLKMLAKIDWDILDEMLSSVHPDNQDHSMATKLIQLARSIQASYGSVSGLIQGITSSKELEDRLSETYGIGPSAVSQFVREVAPIWFREEMSHDFGAARAAALLLQENGYQAFIIGGAVRDLWLGRDPKDFDLVTNAQPDAVQSIAAFRKSSYKDTAQAYGVTRVSFAHNGRAGELEIATFRKDIGAHKGRKETEVEYAEIEDDVLRRDFTINALALDVSTGGVVDFVDGITDLERKLVRFIGDPAERIAEDPLRILRAVRFKNLLGFSYERETALAIHAAVAKGYVEKIAIDRLRDELTKLFVDNNRRQALVELDDFGIADRILPEVTAGKGVKQPLEYHAEGDVWQHQLLILDQLPPHPSLRLVWAALLHDIGKGPTRMYSQVGGQVTFNRHYAVGAEMATTILRRLNFSRRNINDIHWMIYNHMAIDDIPAMTPSHRQKMFGHPAFDDLLELHRADAAASWRPEQPRNVKPEFRDVERLWHEYLSAPPEKRQPSLKRDLGIDGAWLEANFSRELGDNPGPKIGKILESLEAWYRDEGITDEAMYMQKVSKIFTVSGGS